MISHFRAGPIKVRVEIDDSDLPSGFAGVLIKAAFDSGIVELFKAVTLTVSNLFKLARNPKTIDLFTVFLSRFGEAMNDLNEDMAATFEDVSIGEANAKDILNSEYDYLDQQEAERAKKAKDDPFGDFLGK